MSSDDLTRSLQRAEELLAEPDFWERFEEAEDQRAERKAWGASQATIDIRSHDPFDSTSTIHEVRDLDLTGSDAIVVEIDSVRSLKSEWLAGESAESRLPSWFSSRVAAGLVAAAAAVAAVVLLPRQSSPQQTAVTTNAPSTPPPAIVVAGPNEDESNGQNGVAAEAGEPLVDATSSSTATPSATPIPTITPTPTTSSSEALNQPVVVSPTPRLWSTATPIPTRVSASTQPFTTTPTPTPTPAPSNEVATPVATVTPVPAAVSSPTTEPISSTLTPVPPSPTPPSTSTSTPAATATPAPSTGPTATSESTLTAVAPSPTPQPTSTPTPAPTATEVPSATPTSTPAPTALPVPDGLAENDQGTDNSGLPFIAVRWQTPAGVGLVQVERDGVNVSDDDNNFFRDVAVFAPGQVVVYRVRSVEGDQFSAWSAPLSVTVDQATLVIPNSLQATNQGMDGSGRPFIALAWLKPAGITLVEIERDGSIVHVDDNKSHRDVPDPALTVGQVVTYRIRSLVEGQTSEWSAAITVTVAP